MKSDSLLEYLVVNFRWVFVIFFIMPCTVLGKVMSIIEKSLWLHDSGLNHDKNLKVIQKQVSKNEIIYIIICIMIFIFFFGFTDTTEK